LRCLLSRDSRRALALLLAALLAGCDTVGYLGQAAWGQARLVVARHELDAVIRDPTTPATLAAQLQRVETLRAFATGQLGMRGVRGFDTFVATGRSHAVWNVVAAPEFSVVPLSWCFPIAGCVSYRGYFARAAAEGFAASLHARGFDATVYGVAAYSTLGWFSDPVLDTWVMRRERALAALVFHELAHQLVYASGDTAFSESFARVVEREGLRRWLQAAGRTDDYAAWLDEQAADREFAELLGRARERLRALYAESLEAQAMRVRKQRVLAELRAEYADMREHWPADHRFDAWMGQPLDNARLASVANYEQQVPALQALLAAKGGNLEAFYAAARELAALEPLAREARLAALLSG
jgi:predicted aminopeptidase